MPTYDRGREVSTPFFGANILGCSYRKVIPGLSIDGTTFVMFAKLLS